ncbi:unnamed protein product [Adineta ricciae]|uniref:Uncharacterized protein n=1 Tax=Adineta ricciae TaxID=249248 RepID=A0A813P3K0_ADIRI|nr:unnamed protein product [Adineta ricciae]CAF1052582.1 unnamed protein product [Adineta ricciae]
MFAILLLSVYTFALVLSSSVDTELNPKHLDGKQYTIKGIDTVYTQRVSNNDHCTVEVNGQGESVQMLTEGEIIQLKNKWFKVEDCQLNRAYVAECGSKLFHKMRELVCSYATEHSTKKVLKRRQINAELIKSLDQIYYGLCCKTACTVSELLKYCSPK